MSEAPRTRPTWRNRNRMAWMTLAFCAGVIVYVVWRDSGSGVHEAVATMLIGLAGSVIGVYVAGAAYETHVDGRRK